MSTGTKNQFYKYTLRTVATYNKSLCNDKHYLYIVPPEDALTIENLFTHIKITFDSTLASDLQVVRQVGVASERPSRVSETPRYLNVVDVDQFADSNREVDLRLDLTSMLKKDNVAFKDDFGADFETNDMTMIYMKLDNEIRNIPSNEDVGIMWLWKGDGLWTTQGIR